MAKKENQQSWEKIEEQAYHAFREWSIWLSLRQCELSQHLQQSNTPANPTPATAAGTDKQPEQFKTRNRSNA